MNLKERIAANAVLVNEALDAYTKRKDPDFATSIAYFMCKRFNARPSVSDYLEAPLMPSVIIFAQSPAQIATAESLNNASLCFFAFSSCSA